MAYDLLLRRRTSRNWSMHSYYGGPLAKRLLTRGSLAQPRELRPLVLAGYEFAPDPTSTTPEEQQMLARLAVLRMSADAGSKGGKKEWDKAMAKILLVKRKAEHGDDKANRAMTVLRESGIFSGVQNINISGQSVGSWYNPLTWFEAPVVTQAKDNAKAQAIMSSATNQAVRGGQKGLRD